MVSCLEVEAAVAEALGPGRLMHALAFAIPHADLQVREEGGGDTS